MMKPSTLLKLILMGNLVCPFLYADKLFSVSDALTTGGDSLGGSGNALEGEKSIEGSVTESVFGSGQSILGGENSLTSTGGDLDSTFMTHNLISESESTSAQSKLRSPTSIESFSLYDRLSGTTAPYQDSVNMITEVTQTKFEVESLKTDFNLFTERKQASLKIISLWEDEVSNVKSEEEEPLNWGWSLKSSERKSKPKKSWLWD
ncbi:MAG: hypothetical protein FJ116_03450 [Deltaproteobacteria bacterium]|nr:hypothetical protein [Deltaproteobacteria bacterium]